MSDQFSILSLPRLLKMILDQYDRKNSIFGIPSALFFHPEKMDTFKSERFGKLLETPIGVAAGPHTQLAQNIVVAWLCGGRFIELKTIQTLDELEISKPCIDMQDEGYNCEWSQELKIHESFDQYLDAWIIIHILKDRFNMQNHDEPGFIFNMSVGYNYEGILKENVQWFLDKMGDASVELQQKLDSVDHLYPTVDKLKIPAGISDNVTLSTMHGCPPDEIEKIGEYLITERKLHTAVKLNPTLLGKTKLHQILDKSGFETKVPNIAFEHDLKYVDAIKIIRNLQRKANENDVQFSIKLTNTLESINHKDIFPENEKMMYMSGRALHPVSVNLAAKLQNDFKGELDISFCGGVNAFNVADVVSSGLAPVTVCTDILKPGGYGRLNQYIEELRKNADASTALSPLIHLNNYADVVLKDIDYQRITIHDPDIKTSRPLGFFDCIHAPCEDTCPTHQGIPSYMYFTAIGELEKAAEVITSTNPFPHTTGMICDHLCQTKCTRINYDGPVLIREIKRFVAENVIQLQKNQSPKIKTPEITFKIAIIGAGPSGLSCAYYLAKSGFNVKVYELKAKPGGMLSGAIPSFRLTDEAFDLDINRIMNAGVEVEYDTLIDETFFEKLRCENDFIYLAAGAQRSVKLRIEGIDTSGVIDPLEFLFNVKKNKSSGIGKNVVIIGGGNTAMDAARTAYRLVGKNGKVTIVYRRTIKQMPADQGEIKAVMEEGVEIMELTSPLKLNTEDGHVKSLSCIKMRLGEKDESGRLKPEIIPGSEFEIDLDTLIPAIGQELAIDFLERDSISISKGQYETKLENVFIGGDALRGASTAINAIGDGRKAAKQIILKAGMNPDNGLFLGRKEKSPEQHMIDKTKRNKPQKLKETALSDRRNFNLVNSALSREESIKEASRCLLCDELCNICVSVCPNLAFHSYETDAESYKLQKIICRDGEIQIAEDASFKVNQKYQILHLADWCNECGNCTTFCPSSGSPYRDKPHLYFNMYSYDQEENGFYLSGANEARELLGKYNGEEYSLKDNAGQYIFQAEGKLVRISKKDFSIIEYFVNSDEDFELTLQIAAEMKVILRGAGQIFIPGTNQ